MIDLNGKQPRAVVPLSLSRITPRLTSHLPLTVLAVETLHHLNKVMRVAQAEDLSKLRTVWINPMFFLSSLLWIGMAMLVIEPQVKGLWVEVKCLICLILLLHQLPIPDLQRWEGKFLSPSVGGIDKMTYQFN